MSIPSLKTLTLFAALFMLLPLPIMQYVAEESYYALGAYEIFVDEHWWHQSVFGLAWPKTPLFNWFIIAFSQIIGWQHLEIATRLVSVCATWASAIVVFHMARRFFPKHANATWLAALIYLTMGEVCFWYGWLGYADATFGFFIFAAISSLWVAIEDKQLRWLLLSLLLITLAFLTKNISCYVIYASAALVLLWRYKRWSLLIHPLYIAPALISLSAPWLYQHFLLNTGANASIAIGDALRNFTGYGITAYITHWFTYPFLFLARAFPVTLLLIWFYYREKQRYTFQQPLSTLLYILILCLLPFWISASGTPRYLIPFYGLLALLLTGLALQLNLRQTAFIIKVMLFVILLKIPFSLAVLPYIKDWRPERSIVAVVDDIMIHTNGKTLRTLNDVSTGLSIGAYINVRTPHDQYLHWYDGKEREVFVLSEIENPTLGKLVKHYRIQGQHAYLYWRP